MREIHKLAAKLGIRLGESLGPDEIYESAMKTIAPRDMDAIRSFPWELHSAGIEYLLYTLDRSVEDGEWGYCADWHAEKSQQYLTEILRDAAVRTPKGRH
jgi:hypothetical protein